jgi:multimeric flavodoxin WrbA
MKEKAIMIFGSARSDGDTRRVISEFDPNGDIPMIDLNDLNIGHYDYDHKNREDDFIPLMERILQNDVIIIASPVYWYSVSAQMKVFLDRLKDCISIRKDIGRALAGKKMFGLSSHAGSELSAFETTLSGTAGYFDMEYKGTFFYYSGHNDSIKHTNNELPQFREKVNQEIESCQ